MMAASVETREMRLKLKQKTAMPLLWIGMVSIVMLFAGLTSAVIVSKGSKVWETFELPSSFLISTLSIVFSSATFWYAIRSVKSCIAANARVGK